MIELAFYKGYYFIVSTTLDGLVKVVFRRLCKTFKIQARAIFEELSHAFGVMNFFGNRA